MLITLGFIALIVGVILVICGFTVAPSALRPGWGCLILAVVLIVLGYLLPALHGPDYHGMAALLNLSV